MDLAEGHVLALAALQDEDEKRYRVYNLGRGQGLTVLEMIEAMRKATGKKLEYIMEGRR
jgi:UDP-glucose 4-epimerase